METPSQCWKCKLIADSNPGMKCMESIPEEGTEILIPGTNCPFRIIDKLTEELVETRHDLINEEAYSEALNRELLIDAGFE